MLFLCFLKIHLLFLCFLKDVQSILNNYLNKRLSRQSSCKKRNDISYESRKKKDYIQRKTQFNLIITIDPDFNSRTDKLIQADQHSLKSDCYENDDSIAEGEEEKQTK